MNNKDEVYCKFYFSHETIFNTFDKTCFADFHLFTQSWLFPLLSYSGYQGEYDCKSLYNILSWKSGAKVLDNYMAIFLFGRKSSL